MKAGLFSSGLQSESAEQRVQALDSFKPNDPGNHAVLGALIEEDPERAVRKAALDKLGDPELLLQFCISHADPETRGDAGLALAAVLGDESALSEDQVRSLLDSNPKFALPVAKHCCHAALRADTVAALSEAEQAGIIADVEYIDTRHLIAEQLSSEELLQQARNSLKGKDKSAEKIIRSKLDQLHAQQRQQQENSQAAELICGKMEHLASHEWRHESRAQYSVWCQRWSALEFTPDKKISERYRQAAAKVAGIIEQKSQLETVHQQQANLVGMLEENCGELAALSVPQLQAEQPALVQTLNGAREEWSSLNKLDSAEPAVAAQFTVAEKSLTSLLEFCTAIADDSERRLEILESALTGLQWPEKYPAVLAKQEVQTEIDELKAGSLRAKEQAAKKLDKLHKRINRLLGSTKRGDLKRAKRELEAVTKAAQHYSGKDKKVLDERLKQASQAVEKMSDWVNFATEPKYLELCGAMEKLVGSKIHADKLAAQIGELQKRWKALGHSDSADKLWERFKTAGDQAYAPCETFFQQRHELRKKNLAQREPLVKQMRNLLEATDWDESPDYKKVEAELSRIHNAWQDIKDVERGPGQKQWQRISKLRSAVYEKLDVVYDANIDMKNQLIDKVLKMLEGEIKEDSLAKLQLYQKRWKQVGVTRRKQDQAAWKKFKKATDGVYNEIQELRKAKRADEDAQLDGYREISRQIQQLAKSASDLSEADRTFDQLQADYKSLPALPAKMPEKLIKGLASDYRRACDAYSKARDRIKHAAKTKILDALASKAALCAEMEQLGADGPAGKIKELQQALSEIEISDKALAQKMDERIAAALDTDRGEANQRRQLMCIDLEILLGVDSPGEDASLRMQVQLERMKKHGLGQAQAKSDDELNRLHIEWLCLPGADPEIQQALDQRFQRLINKRRN